MARSRTDQNNRARGANTKRRTVGRPPKLDDQPTVPLPDGFITLGQAGKRLLRHPRNVRRMIDYGELQGYRVGRELVVLEASLDRWLKPKPVKARVRNSRRRLAFQHRRQAEASETPAAVDAAAR